MRLYGATGGLTKNGPLVCGGFNSDTYSQTNAFLALHNSKFIETNVKLQKERNMASAVVLPNCGSMEVTMEMGTNCRHPER